jgi:hypothetical protein
VEVASLQRHRFGRHCGFYADAASGSATAAQFQVLRNRFAWRGSARAPVQHRRQVCGLCQVGVQAIGNVRAEDIQGYAQVEVDRQCALGTLALGMLADPSEVLAGQVEFSQQKLQVGFGLRRCATGDRERDLELCLP